MFCEAWESQLCDMAMLLREINDVFEGRRGASQLQAPQTRVRLVWDGSVEGTGEFYGQDWSLYPHNSRCFKATGTKKRPFSAFCLALDFLAHRSLFIRKTQNVSSDMWWAIYFHLVIRLLI